MKYFIWASPHKPTVQQKEELKEKGALLYLEEIAPELFLNLINLEINTNLDSLVSALTDVLSDFKEVALVQPAGSPAFQYVLGAHGIAWSVLYSFSERKSKDVPQEDGTIKKVSVFEHKGWIKV
jgi:hypothetical protein